MRVSWWLPRSRFSNSSPKRTIGLCRGPRRVKASDKLAVIENLAGKADSVMVGGGMCFTFLRRKAFSVGTSLLQDEMIDTCRELRKPTATCCTFRWTSSSPIGSPADASSGNRCGAEHPEGG